MTKTEYMVYYIDNETDGSGHHAVHFADGHDGPAMSRALAFMQLLREPNRGITFVTMASESADNVGKMGVGAVVDGKCPDGGDFLGRLSRYGMHLRRGR